MSMEPVQAVPATSTSSSTGSTVVPAALSTTERCCSSLFSSGELANVRTADHHRRGPHPASTSASRGASGSASVRASNRSPEPRRAGPIPGAARPARFAPSWRPSASLQASSTFVGQYRPASCCAAAPASRLVDVLMPTRASTTTSSVGGGGGQFGLLDFAGPWRRAPSRRCRR